MSTLSNNLQQIYTIKNQIKEVIGTTSDVFADYPEIISEAIAGGGGVTPTGSAYFYVVRNPEEENEEILPFTDYTSQAGYPCFGYNFGNFEYTQGEGAQLVIFPMSSEEEGVDRIIIKGRIESPLFNTEGEDPVDVYVNGPSTIETSNDSTEAQVIIDQAGNEGAPDAPTVYITRSISNLELYIEKTNTSYTWSGRWEWQ